MAWVDKAATNLQLFRGSKAYPDVFLKAHIDGTGCCPDGSVGSVAYDKLARRVRFDNGLNHTSPLGGREIVWLPAANGNGGVGRDDVLAHINDVGVGATISTHAIPTYAFMRGIGVHIESEEPGFTFNVITRNGLALPDDINGAGVSGAECEPVRTALVTPVLTGLGALGGDIQVDVFGRYAAADPFALEADEVQIEVATMPAGGTVTGAFSFYISVAYELIHRAEV